METQFLFGLGAFFGIVIVVLGYSILGVFRLFKKVEVLESFSNNVSLELDDTRRNYTERIDGVERQLYTEIKEFNRELDSRLDKLENRITSKIPSVKEVV